MTETPTTLNYHSKEGKEYTIQLLTADDSLSIKIFEKDDFLGGYKVTKKLEQFQKLGRSFRIFDKILEIRDFLVDIIKDQNISISKKNESLILSLQISVANKTENILFELEKDDFDEKASLILACKKISEMQAEIKELKEMKYMLFGSPEFHMSRVVMKESELDFVKEEIKKNLGLQKNLEDIKFTPLFSTARDGDMAKEFHKKCDGKSNSLVLVKTKTGKRFGGFTSLHWSYASSGNWASDSKAFLFSLDKKKCYNIVQGNESYAIYCHSSYGPYFGDLYISNNCLYSHDNYASINYYNYNDEKYALNGEEQNFYVDVYEVYQLNN